MNQQSFSCPLVPHLNTDRNHRSRLNKYLTWVGVNWLTPDLESYRDFLFDEGLKSSTISVHLSTIRGAYRKMISDKDLFSTQTTTLRTEDVDEAILFIKDAIDSRLVEVRKKASEYQSNIEPRRLTTIEIDALLKLPGVKTLQGLRDTVIISMLLYTGIRERELVNLVVSDLHHTIDGKSVLLVRQDNANRRRSIAYNDHAQCWILVNRWLSRAGIAFGPVFRAFWKGCKKVRSTPITTAGIEDILRGYPLLIGGVVDYTRPHDLRCTYANLLYRTSFDTAPIQQNLGHRDPKTTLGYIGDP